MRVKYCKLCSLSGCEHERSERALYPALCDWLNQIGPVYAEVPVYRCRTDLVAQTNNSESVGSESVGIEAKWTNARNGLHQAIINQIAYTYSYLALPAMVAHNLLTDRMWPRAACEGVGLLCVAPDRIDILHTAKESKYLNAALAHWITGQLDVCDTTVSVDELRARLKRNQRQLVRVTVRTA